MTIAYNRFGPLDVEVSRVGFGGAAVSGEGGGYGFGDISEQEAISLLHEALEAGINLFDTAPIYGFGLSEKRIGKAFFDRRDKVFIVSKSGVSWDENKRVNMTNSPEVTERMLNQSLRDLQTDYIDLYMIHWPDQKVDIREPMAVLARALDNGKIRAIGLCNSSPEDIGKAQEVAPVTVLQNNYNLFDTSVEETLFPLCRAQSLGFMSYGTLDKGILTGRVTADRKFDASDARSKAPWWKKESREPKYQAMAKILPLIAEQGYSPLQMALGFVLDRQEVSTALCGMRHSEQLRTAIEAAQNPPPKDLLDEVFNIAKAALAGHE